MTASGPDSALQVLCELEALGTGGTGALMFGAETKRGGVVLVEQGRVCWAAAPGLRQRLTDLLRQCCVPPLGAEEMEQLFQQCREQGRPIGEKLVELGLVSSISLRSALLHHTAESLCSTDSWRESPRWVEHRQRGYQSAYTFTSQELLSYSGALARGRAVVDEADGMLRELAQERSSAVFDPSVSALLTCRLPADVSVGLRSLRRAGSWAALSFAESAEAPAQRVLKFVLDGSGGTWIGWRHQELTFLVHCADRADFSRMLKAMSHRGWTAAVQSAVPFTPPTQVATG